MQSHVLFFACYHGRMPSEIDPWREEILQNLEALNARVERQMSLWHVFRNGVMYGSGFIIGSTVLTATIVTIIITFFNDTIFGAVVSWIAERG